MNWQKIKLTLKNTWYFFAIAALVIVGFVVFGAQSLKISNLIDELQKQSEKNRRELDELNKIRQEEQQKRQQIELKYQETIKQIEKTHAEAIARLDKEKKEEMKRLIEQFQDDPDKMAAAIHGVLGIPIQ